MLDSITGFLRERKLLDPIEEPSYSVTLVSGEVANIGAHTRSRGFYHVRLKADGVLPAEYANYCRAWKAFPQHVPEPLVRCEMCGWEIIVIRGVRHRHLTAGSLKANKYGLIPKIAAFMEASNSGARVAAPKESHRMFLRRLLDRDLDSTSAAIVAEWVDVDALDSLPHIRQHGDFVINNLGWSDVGLVVFDWEDFGRIELPGFDLCTLLASDVGLDPLKVRAMIGAGERRTDPYADLIASCCPVIGMTPDLFRRLIPLYLVIFLNLKREYGKAIVEAVCRLIREIRCAPELRC